MTDIFHFLGTWLRNSCPVCEFLVHGQVVYLENGLVGVVDESRAWHVIRAYDQEPFKSLGVCRFEIYTGVSWVVCGNLVIGQVGVYDEEAA